MSPTVARRDKHILPPPQAKRPASGAEASTHPFGAASWKGFARGGTVGDMDVDDKAPWMGSRRVPTWAWPFRGALHASELAEHGSALQKNRAQGALLRAMVLEQDQDGAIAALRRGRRMEGEHRSEEHTSELQSLMRNSYA